tara:strand:- start:329 stop:580 length:252 start_codon:yes stop_codon:yes gene_type:complete
MDENLTHPQALKLLERYKQAYCDLVARGYIVIATYEKFLLDNASHLELAEEMKAMLDMLPDDIIDGRPPEGPEPPPETSSPPW